MQNSRTQRVELCQLQVASIGPQGNQTLEIRNRLLGAVGEREALLPEMDRKNFPDLHKASRGCGRFRLPAAWKETVRQEKRPAADTVSRFSDSDFAASIHVEPSDEMSRAFDSGFDAFVRVEPLDEMCRAFDSGFDVSVRVEQLDKNELFF